MDWYIYVIAIIGAAVAGGINTLAGNGSAITLTILTELIGLPGNLANGTNRVGVLTQSMASTYVFYKNDKLDIARSWAHILFTVIGAIIGIVVAIKVSNEQFIQVFRFLMILMLFVILVKPKRWLRQSAAAEKPNLWVVVPAFLALGFYGGFIQMGMGVFFLAVMVLGAKYSIIEANAVKAPVVGIYTILAILIFHFQGMIEWKIGLLMAVGQTLGGYYAAVFATRYKKADVWAHRVLVAVVILAIVKLFDLHLWLWPGLGN